ncbi:13700_t:CDS:2 [Racocetra fulgida]|uniref:13700_t:CDS:1 n=1 Tax=Racocetra fulgida TaxID=60492 RepID=A0A9N9NGL5_9GLOM|nr:13700_t:CDS:2 [Racocetra fulgida]
MTLTRISRNEIPNVPLSKIDYERYKSKFPGSLKQDVSFSNQLKVHGQLRNIRDENNFTDEFFTAARIYTNKITIDVDNYSSLTDASDSVSETYTFDDEQSINSQQSRPSDNERLITNKAAEVQTAPIDNNGLQPVYKLWKNAKFVETENNALKVENYALKFELSTLKTKYIDLEKEVTNLKEKIAASNERKIFLESQGTKFKYTIKTLKDTIKGFEATIKDLRNNEINLKAQHKELLKELTLLKNKNEEAENRKKQLENKIKKIIEDRNQLINIINKLRKKGKELKNKYKKEKQEIQNKLDELEAERINKIVENSKGGCN